MKISILENKKIAIYGFGKTGKEVYKALRESYSDIKIIDDRYDSDKVLNSLEALEVINDFDILIKSPGIKPNSKILKEFKNKVVNDIELAYVYLKDNNLKTKIVSITGTNGKTTTTHIVNEIIKNNGYKSFVCGNIGVSPLTVLNTNEEVDYLVMELSSYQLRNIEHFMSDYSLFLNIDIDHMDYHNSFADYFMSKLNVFRVLNRNNIIVGPSVVKKMKKMRLKSVIRTPNYNLKAFNLSSTQIPSENLILILNLLDMMNMDYFTTYEYIKEFKGLEHRLEKVSSPIDIDFINDSKATNVMATNTAIDAMNKPITLILGGSYKNEDYTKLDFKNKKIKNIIVTGENQREFKYIEDAIFVKTFKEAFYTAVNVAKDGEVILLSPASASFDEFENYEQRGKEFKRLVEELR